MIPHRKILFAAAAIAAINSSRMASVTVREVDKDSEAADRRAAERQALHIERLKSEQHSAEVAKRRVDRRLGSSPLSMAMRAKGRR